jgi:hypothetical protein
MTPSAYIALARDLVILIALGLLIWLLIVFGRDMVKVKDMKAVQQQITQNATTEAQWRQEQTDANTLRDTQLAQVGAAIAGQHAPILLCRPSRPSPVPSASATTPGSPAGPGGADATARVDPLDVRPAINDFELRVEKAVADCRAALAGWPQ